MKQVIAAIFTSAFMATASAGSIYHGFADGNLDLHSPFSVQMTDSVTGVQPGVGGQVDIYRGFERNNKDLFSGSASSGGSAATRHNDIYGGFGIGNQDLY